jgi:hypothetical protein
MLVIAYNAGEKRRQNGGNMSFLMAKETRSKARMARAKKAKGGGGETRFDRGRAKPSARHCS